MNTRSEIIEKLQIASMAFNNESCICSGEIELIPSIIEDKELHDLLIACWTRKEIYNGIIGLNPIRELLENEFNAESIKFGMVQIGGGGNGDPILLNKAQNVFYFAHDEYNESNFNKCTEIYGDLGDFLDKFIDFERIPSDTDDLRKHKSHNS